MDNVWPPEGREGSALNKGAPIGASKTSRVHLVGVFPGDQHVHLGPYTLPGTQEQSPTLTEFATIMKRLVRVTHAQGQDTWWRFEYSCYGNTVPILSDEALKEAFAYFREQHENLSPEAAAAACRLYLMPTATQPGSWSLTEYLSETRVAPSLNRQGSQSNGGRSGAQPEPSDAANGAATAAGGRGDGGASSSSSHEATDQHMAAAAAGTSSVRRAGRDQVPPVLLAGADNSSFSARKQSSPTPGWNYANAGLQQQQQHYIDSEAASRVAKRQAVAAVGRLEQQGWHLEHSQQQQQQQQQQQLGTGPAATAAQAAGLVPPALQQQILSSMNANDSRGAKAVKRESNNSPRSQWQQQQPGSAAAAVNASQLLLQQQGQAGVTFVSPFAAAAGASTASGVAAADHVLALQAQQQLLQVGQSCNSFMAAQGLSVTPQHLQHVANNSAGQINPHVADLVRSGLIATLSGPSQPGTATLSGPSQPGTATLSGPSQPGTATLSGPSQPGTATLSAPGQPGTADSDTEGAACSLGPHVDQLQQLHLSTFNSNGVISAGQGTTAAAAVGAGWLLSNQHQQQQLSAANPSLAAQLTAANQGEMLYCGSTGDLAMLTGGDIARSGSQLDLAAATTASGARTRESGAGASADGGMQVTLPGTRIKSETKTKYADGRFKDEARHQQRLHDMAKRCNALFDGAITNQFRVEHHKRVTCLVCNATVVPYEAYHIDAVRKHFVRHHEPWLAEQGVDVDVWRKSCAPIAKGTSRSSSAGAAKADTGAVAAFAAASEPASARDATAADLAEEEAAGRRPSGTRLPDGRYKDPQQHAQRLADMQARCTALFNGTMTQHWSINNHKSITCHLCDQHITPYAAYHPDCLRKHFVRKHEDMLTAAGVDVAAWSKGIPLGRRKLKALLLQQQQQQPVLGPQEQHAPDMLLQLQEQQRNVQQPVLLQPTSSGAVAHQQQQQQMLLLQLQNEPGSWSWALIQQQQQQQALLAEQPSLGLPMQAAQQETLLKRSSSSSKQSIGSQPTVLLQQSIGSQPQLMQLMLDASAPAEVELTVPTAIPAPSLVGPSLTHVPGTQQQQQQQLSQVSLQQQTSISAVQQGLKPMQQQQQRHSAAGVFNSPELHLSDALGIPSSGAMTAVVQFSQPQVAEGANAQATGSLPSLDAACTPFLATAAETCMVAPSSSDPSSQANKQFSTPPGAVPEVHQQQQQQQQRTSPVAAARSALAPALAAAAAAGREQQPSSGVQPSAKAGTVQHHKAPTPAAAWLHNTAEVPMSLAQTPAGFAAMSIGQTPGFGPMSLSPMIGMTDLGMGGIESLTEDDVAAMWEDDDADQALADVLLQHGGMPWSLGS